MLLPATPHGGSKAKMMPELKRGEFMAWYGVISALAEIEPIECVPASI